MLLLVIYAHQATIATGHWLLQESSLVLALLDITAPLERNLLRLQQTLVEYY